MMETRKKANLGAMVSRRCKKFKSCWRYSLKNSPGDLIIPADCGGSRRSAFHFILDPPAPAWRTRSFQLGSSYEYRKAKALPIRITGFRINLCTYRPPPKEIVQNWSLVISGRNFNTLSFFAALISTHWINSKPWRDTSGSWYELGNSSADTWSG